MSVTGDYLLILGCDQTPPHTVERLVRNACAEADRLYLNTATRKLAKLIEKQDWWGAPPLKGKIDQSLVYYWRSTVGPYFKAPDGSPPLEALIEIVRKDFPDLEKHYSLIVWVENQLERIDGTFAEHNIDLYQTVVLPGGQDVRRSFEKVSNELWLWDGGQ
jgi:hypothetical protein